MKLFERLDITVADNDVNGLRVDIEAWIETHSGMDDHDEAVAYADLPRADVEELRDELTRWLGAR